MEPDMAVAKLDVRPVAGVVALKDKVYEGLKRAITTMEPSLEPEGVRLDERRLSEDFGVSRTPIREAIARLEQEGFIRTIPRRGAFVVRKSKAEVLEMICVWAALEGMAARLITRRATDEEIASLREMFTTFENHQVRARIDEYSDTNIRFHQAILAMSHNHLLNEIAENLFIHMRAIRSQTISEADRASRSIIDHLHIIEALEHRDTELAARLVTQHTMNLGTHVERNVTWLS